MGFGMVLRDSMGEFCSARTAFVDGLFAAKEGEAMSLFQAIEWVYSLGFQHAVFESDSKILVVAFLSSPRQNFSEFGTLVESSAELFFFNMRISMGSSRIGKPMWLLVPLPAIVYSFIHLLSDLFLQILF